MSNKWIREEGQMDRRLCGLTEDAVEDFPKIWQVLIYLQRSCIDWVDLVSGKSGIIFQMLKSNCKWVEVPNWRQLKLGPCCSQFITPCIKIMENIILIDVFRLQNYVKTLKLLNQKHHLHVIVLCLINLSNNTIFVVKTSKS